jgi:DNA-binding NarL/FixJ family response regulator
MADENYWNSITAAELKVIHLVAEGMTNNAIADALHLSRLTVETHLKHIFSKLGLSNRAALAAQAIRRGLVQQ